MTSYPPAPFRRAAVEPAECLKQGFALIKPQYWLVVGISAVGIIVGSIVPLGILLGPMMCGIYIVLLKLRRDQPIEFNDLFKGFDHFGQSLIATLIHVVPILVVFVPSYIAFYVSILFMIPRQGSEPDPAMMFGFLGAFAVFYLIMLVFIVLISILFTFTYPLIVDRGFSGVDAVKMSMRAAFANFWRLLALYLINTIITVVGVLFCYVGALFVLPITFGAIATAYEQVFGLGSPVSNLPPPPPTFN